MIMPYPNHLILLTAVLAVCVTATAAAPGGTAIRKDHMVQQVATCGGSLIPGKSYWYDYDRFGNRIGSIQRGGLKLTTTVNTANQIVSRENSTDLYLAGHVWKTRRTAWLQLV